MNSLGAELEVADLAAEVEHAADPATYVVQACERAKIWLMHALEHGDIEQIVELKSHAEAIRVYTMSKQLGKDAQFAATEIVRRAERGIGLAIRRGQEAGEILRRGEHTGNQYTVGKQGYPTNSKPSPYDFASPNELDGDGGGIYAMADGVPDGHFEAALDEAKAEGNLSRANVVRKVRAVAAANDADGLDWIPEPHERGGLASMRRRYLVAQWAERGYTSTQIAERLRILPETVRRIARAMTIAIPADDAMGKNTRKSIDSNRIVRETVNALEGIAMGIELVDIDDLDPAEMAYWVASLTDSIRALNRLKSQMKEKTQ